MKVIIAGSRTMDPYHAPLIAEAVAASKFEVTEVVCGMAPGADLLGLQWAEAQGIPVKRMPANWAQYKNAAGPIRNEEMAMYGDALILLMWNKSPGSRNMLQAMQSLGKPVFVVQDGKLPARKILIPGKRKK